MVRLKQVILIRKDLKMRRGKEIAQGSHASMEFIASQFRQVEQDAADGDASVTISSIEQQWMAMGMAKICLQVNSEEELILYHQKACNLNISSHLIRDSGKTEFGGVPTFTACAIGPGDEEILNKVTGGLKLY